ncbi:MAG: OmpA family protein [Bacteroidetes bacterium]|nr:OmpA family protein [Bacteroidota bacterium]
MTNCLWVVMFCMVSCVSKAQYDTCSIFYPTNVFELDKTNESKLDSLIDTWLKHFPESVAILGYADHVGDSTDNYKLSIRRARNAKQYLEKKIPSRFITSCKGNGELKSSVNDSLGVLDHRRVDIISFHAVAEAELKIDTNIKVLFHLDTVKTGQNLKLPNLNFYPGRHIPLPASQSVLKQLLVTMQANPKLKIDIEGHICCERKTADGYDMGTGEYKLSENRAKFVYQYLVQGGIDPKRMNYKGFGRTRPIHLIEMNEIHREQNRRVEIVIIAK